MCKEKVFRVVEGSKFSVVGNDLYNKDGSFLGEKIPDYKVYIKTESEEVVLKGLQKIEWSKRPGESHRICLLHFTVLDSWNVDLDFLDKIVGETSIHVVNNANHNRFHNKFHIVGIGEIKHSISTDDPFEWVVVELQTV